MSNRRWLMLVLLVGFAYRAPGLGAPILGEHAWRQADTAAMARNFSEHGYDFLHPRIDWGGAGSGIVESELPLYPFAVALLYGALGPSVLLARGLSLLLSLATLVLLHRLVREHADEKTALWASASFAILPLAAFFGRAVMPEPLLLLASVGGVYHFSRWARGGSAWHFSASAAAISTACLLKPASLYLGGPLLYLAWLRLRGGLLRSPWIWLYGVLVLAPVALWYLHAHRIFLETGLSFGIWGYGTDKWGNWGLVTSGAYWDRVLLHRLGHRHLTWFGFAVFLAGLCLRRRDARERVFDVWLAALAVYLVVVGVGNFAHSYYQLPLLIPAVAFMGKAYSRHFRWPPRSPVAALLALALLGTALTSAVRLRQLHARERPEASSVFQLARELRRVSEPADRVLSTSRDPSLLYLAHRKGWATPLEELPPETVLERVREGARFAAGTRGPEPAPGPAARHLEALRREHRLRVETDRYWIVELDAR